MDGLLLAVILILLLIVLYPALCELFTTSSEEGMVNTEKVQPVSVLAFKSADPIKAKYTMQWDGDEWGLNSAEKYYENLLYYNTGMSSFDPAGPGMFDDPAGAPPLPGQTEIDRLGYEVLQDQAAGQKYMNTGKNLSFAPAHTQDSMENPV